MGQLQQRSGASCPPPSHRRQDPPAEAMTTPMVMTTRLAMTGQPNFSVPKTQPICRQRGAGGAQPHAGRPAAPCCATTNQTASAKRRLNPKP